MWCTKVAEGEEETLGLHIGYAKVKGLLLCCECGHARVAVKVGGGLITHRVSTPASSSGTC